MSAFERHNFGQQRHQLEKKLKLRSLYKGISNGSVRNMDPFDFKEEFKQMVDSKLHDTVEEVQVGKPDLLNTLHQSLRNNSHSVQVLMKSNDYDDTQDAASRMRASAHLRKSTSTIQQ